MTCGECRYWGEHDSLPAPNGYCFVEPEFAPRGGDWIACRHFEEREDDERCEIGGRSCDNCVNHNDRIRCAFVALPTVRLCSEWTPYK